MHIYKVKGRSILEHTTAASKFTRRSSSEKSAFPKGMWTIPVLSALYSTFPFLNSAIAWNAFDQSISLSKIIIGSSHIISATKNLYNEIRSLNALSSTLVCWYMLNTHNGDKSATIFLQYLVSLYMSNYRLNVEWLSKLYYIISALFPLFLLHLMRCMLSQELVSNGRCRRTLRKTTWRLRKW